MKNAASVIVWFTHKFLALQKGVFFFSKTWKKPPSKIAHNWPRPFYFTVQPIPDHSPHPRIDFSYHEISEQDICTLICGHYLLYLMVHKHETIETYTAHFSWLSFFLYLGSVRRILSKSYLLKHFSQRIITIGLCQGYRSRINSWARSNTSMPIWQNKEFCCE